jgi:hypothetical protein
MRSLLIVFVSLTLAGSAFSQSHGGFHGGSTGGRGFSGGHSSGGRSFSRGYGGAFRGGGFGTRSFGSRNFSGWGRGYGGRYRGGYGGRWYGGGSRWGYRPYFNTWNFAFGFGSWWPSDYYDPYVYDYPSYYYGDAGSWYSYPGYSYDPYYYSYGSSFRAPVRRPITRGYYGRPGPYVGDGRWHHFNERLR